MLGILDPQEKTTREAEEQIAGAAVVCWGVTKDFGAGDTRIQALRGVDLEVRPGELTLLVGPSGCGKTTLISIIAGLLNLDIGLPVAELRGMLRPCLAGEAEHEETLLDAINRRGRRIKCRVTCSPLVLPDKKREGIILLMEEVAA